jgi:hypothetical protein
VVNILNCFLWDGKPPRVKNAVIQQDIELGGLKMTNLKNFIISQKIKWVDKLLKSRTCVPFSYLNTFIEMELEDFLKCNFDTAVLPEKLPNFYKEILTCWFNYMKPPESTSDIQRSVIWFNLNVKIDNKMIFYRRLYENGLVFMNDILDQNGNFISHRTLTERYGNHLTQYEYMCLKHAIPQSWKKLLKSHPIVSNIDPQNETIFITTQNGAKPISIVKSRNIYIDLMKRKITQPTCIEKWHEKYDITFTEEEWKKIFALAKIHTLDTRVIEFQYKVIHRTYASDSMVSNFDHSVSKMCTLCNTENNIVHQFIDCVNVTQFWQDLKDWFQTVFGKEYNLTLSNILFGLLNIVSVQENFSLLYAKFFIHHNKGSMINLNHYKKFICHKLTIELNIAYNHDKSEAFMRDFRVLIDYFEIDM